MSEVTPVREEFPHLRYGSDRNLRPFQIAHAQGVVVGPAEYALAVASIAAERMGKKEFNFIENRSQSKPHAFIRQIVYAHLRFGFRHELAFPEIGKIAKRDHTTVIHGIRSLFCKIEHEPKTSRLFNDICADVRKEWPDTDDIRDRMANWMRLP